MKEREISGDSSIQIGVEPPLASCDARSGASAVLTQHRSLPLIPPRYKACLIP